MPSDEGPAYEVGYRKPPRRTRFKPGQSGNPRGRPKGAKDLSSLFTDALNELVVVTENGRRRKVSKCRAFVTQLVNQSAKGDRHAIKILLDILRDIEARSDPGPADQPAFDAGDEKVIAQLKARLQGIK